MTNPEKLRQAIAKAVEACEQKNATAFAALFTSEGKLELARGQKIRGRNAIAAVTADYFANLEEIRIVIKEICLDGDGATIEWIWDSVEQSTGKSKHAETTIALSFQGEAIALWQEAIERKQQGNT